MSSQEENRSFSSELEALKDAIAMAHPLSEEKGFHLKQKVGHDGESNTYEIEEINGDMARIIIPPNDRMPPRDKVVPLKELYDADTFIELRANNAHDFGV